MDWCHGAFAFSRTNSLIWWAGFRKLLPQIISSLVVFTNTFLHLILMDSYLVTSCIQDTACGIPNFVYEVTFRNTLLSVTFGFGFSIAMMMLHFGKFK